MKKLNIFLSLSCGLLLTASYPSMELSFLAWIALIPLLIAINGQKPKTAFFLGWIAGLIHFVSLVYWLVNAMYVYGGLSLLISIPLLILLASYLALNIGLFAYLVQKVQSVGVTGFIRNIIMLFFIPSIWVSIEYLRSFTQFAFPWELLGYSQYKFLSLIQVADILGVYGISFILVLGNVFLMFPVLYLLHKDWNNRFISLKAATYSLIGFCCMIVIVCGYGFMRMDEISQISKQSKTLKVSVVQGNINQDCKWDAAFRLFTTKKYLSMSDNASKQNKPELIVWPETALPYYFGYDDVLTEKILQETKQINSNLLFGSLSFAKENELVRYYNSAFLINASGEVVGKYDKVHLVPYGEYVPFKNLFWFLDKMVVGVGDFSAGKQGFVIFSDKAGYGIQICYEIIFPELSRAMVSKGATLLVNITNDAWYGYSSAPYQHFSMAVLRAVENKRPVARAANTGISGFIDPVGHILESSSLFEDSVLTTDLNQPEIKTFYTRYGDIFSISCLFITVLAFIGLFFYSRYGHF